MFRLRLLGFAALLLHAGLCAGVDIAIPISDPVIRQIPARTLKPEGGGPFPAIVLLHDCSGFGARSSGGPGRWAKVLVDHGYAVILPDSFTPRGHPDGICTVPFQQRHGEVTPRHRAEDAYATLAVVKTLPYVAPDRVGVMGASHGGASTLATMAAPQAAQKGFIAAVALYPGCAINIGSWNSNLSGVYSNTMPLHILIGEIGRLDPGGELPQAGRLGAAGWTPGHDQDLSRRASWVRQRGPGPLYRESHQPERARRTGRDHRRRPGRLGRQHPRSHRLLRPAPGEATMKASAYDLQSTFAVLGPGCIAVPVEDTPTIYEDLDRRFDDFRDHRLVSIYTFDSDWPTWEMHPAGDEVVCLLEGEAGMVFDRGGTEETVTLTKPGSYVIVPKGTWHTARVSRSARMLFITPGEGTQNRALAEKDRL